jgi:hypothetical protein
MLAIPRGTQASPQDAASVTLVIMSPNVRRPFRRHYCIKATLIASAVLSVRAAIVNVGFAAPDVGKSEEPANQRL